MFPSAQLLASEWHALLSFPLEPVSGHMRNAEAKTHAGLLAEAVGA